MILKRLTCASLVATLAFGVCNAALADESELSPEVRIMLRRLEAAEKQIADLKSQVEETKSTRQQISELKDQIDETRATQQQLSDNQSQLSQTQLRMYEISAEALSAEAAKPAGQDLTMKASWKNGLELQTADKQFRIHIGGRTQLDSSWYAVDDQIDANSGAAPGTSNRYEDGVDFRRARLRIDGDMYEQMEFAVEYDFINSARVRNSAGTGTTDFDLTGFTDVWWQFKELPGVGNIRIGNQKEPIGFEHMVSSRFLPFMERSYNQDTFYGGSFNGFTPGISAFDSYAEDTGSWHVGVFKPTDNVFASNANNGDYAVTGRLTKLLWYECEGEELFHVGIAGRQFSTVGDRIRFRTRDAVRAGISQQWPLPADTGNLFGDNGQWMNLETAAVHGSWTFQAEYLASFTHNAGLTAPTATNDLFYQGGYVQVMYFLTGEHDNYHKGRAAFDRVKPNRNFRWMRTDCDDCNTGWGAWQVGVRYNYLDLNDSGINGGELNNYTAGINWFLNPNMKIQANYILTDRNAATGGADGNIHGWGFRLAHDF